MALKSFYQDIVIDTPEAAARFEAFLEEEPHPIITDESTYSVNDPEVIRRIGEKYGSNGSHQTDEEGPSTEEPPSSTD